MSSESVYQVARSWVDVGSFPTRLLVRFMILTVSVRNILDTPSQTDRPTYLCKVRHYNFFSKAQRPFVGQGLLIIGDSRSHSKTYLDEWSSRYRDLCLTTHRHPFELAIPTSELSQTHGLYREAAGIGWTGQNNTTKYVKLLHNGPSGPKHVRE
jgi:hypothetical protein